jgi:small subunit ribosomal protein S6
MEKFEIMIIAHVSLGESGAKSLSKKVQEEIVALGGDVTNNNFWGKRKFAYPIKHESEGFYEVSFFDLDKGKLNQLKSKLNLVEGLVRYLISTEEKNGN